MLRDEDNSNERVVVQTFQVVYISVCGLCMVLSACTARESHRDEYVSSSEGKAPRAAGAEGPSGDTVTPSVAERFPAPREPVYDLTDARIHQESADQIGRTISRVYKLVDGQSIVITYSWEGGTNRCAAAEARVGRRTIAKAVSKGLAKNSDGGYEIEVEESQFDESGGEVYRGRIRYRLGYRTRKVAEWPVSGRKVYEIFLDWGGFR